MGIDLNSRREGSTGRESSTGHSGTCGATHSPLPGNSKLKIRSARLQASGQSTGGEITAESPIDVEFEFLNYHDAVLNFALHLFNVEGA
jgi:hypothetical protein